MLDLEALSSALEAHGVVVRVVLADVRGSTPRSTGTAMLVWDSGTCGTIGGGRLEWDAIAVANAMLEAGSAQTATRTFALGPALNQCCGGAVTVAFERWDVATYRALTCDFAGIYTRPVAQDAGDIPAALRRKCSTWAHRDQPLPTTLQGGWLAEAVWRNRLPIYIHGAGHVGQALARVLHPMPGFELCVSDTRSAALDKLPAGIGVETAPPTDVIASAPDIAAHLIMKK